MGLAWTVGAIYLNQVLFTVYVTAVRGGDVSFVARYLPLGWFDIARGPVWSGLASAWPYPQFLGFSVLSVQVGFELPFVILAYLLVVAWLDRGLLHVLLQSIFLWSACVTYSAIFIWIEFSLRNPWTLGDVGVRTASTMITPVLIRRWVTPRQVGTSIADLRLKDILAFLICAASLAGLVLIVYDTALLYNFAHLAEQGPAAVCCVALIAVSRYWIASDDQTFEGNDRIAPGGLMLHPALVDQAVAGPGLAVLSLSLRWFLLIFFVPALPLRYGLVYFGSRTAGLAIGAIVATSLVLALWEVGRALWGTRIKPAMYWWAGELLIALVAACTASRLFVRWPDTHTETRLLAVVLVFAAVSIVLLATGDAAARRMRCMRSR